MKNITLTMMLLSVGFDAICKPASATFNGSINLEDQEYDALTVNGAANFTNIKAVTLHANGALNAEDCVFEKATISGGVNLDNCLVSKTLTVHGGFHTQDSKYADVTVHGGFCAENSEITGKTIVMGGSNCTDCTLNEFVCNGRDIVFKNCDISGSITVEKLSTHWFWSFFTSEKQELKLTTTAVHGDISFEKDGGIVILKGDCKIHGKVINGTIIS